MDPSTFELDPTDHMSQRKKPTHPWNAHFYDLTTKLRVAGCTHFKFHPYPSFAGMHLKSSIAYARRTSGDQKVPKILVDTKEHDTADTVVRAIEDYVGFQADFVTVHASCGPATFKAIRSAGFARYVIAVTVLTDMEQEDVMRVYQGEVREVAKRLASIPLEYDVNFLVCAAPDIPTLREDLRIEPSDCRFATPGIRPKGSKQDGQIRIATPTEAVQFGSSMLIAGRPILRSLQPEKVFVSMEEEIRVAVQKMQM